MLHLTDIPDWIVCEGTGKFEFDYKHTGTPELLNQLYERSPIKHVDKVEIIDLFF